LIGENAQILYPSEEDYRYVGTEKYAQIREQGIGTVETRWQQKDGRIIEILLSSAVLDLEDMHTASFTALDITEQKRAQEALNTYAERLEEMVAERTEDLQQVQEKLVRQEKLATLGQLAGGLAHELRTPLGVIKNSAYYISLVLEEPDPTLMETLTILDQEIDHAEAIIRALLDFASTEMPVLLELDLNIFLERFLSKFELPEQVDLVTDWGRDVPLIRADATQLERVFENLILNAIQAMPEGGTLTVATEAVQEGQVLVTVDDTGVGIPPEQLDEIFEPLFSTKTTGIGLGLSLAKNLVAAHGGHIEVESGGRPGEGTTFKVYLPINRKEEIGIDDA
jgi:two-component system sensor kinase FixL